MPRTNSKATLYSCCVLNGHEKQIQFLTYLAKNGVNATGELAGLMGEMGR